MGEAARSADIQTFLSTGFLARVDEWRRRHPDLPDRYDAIRMLVEDGIRRWDFKQSPIKITRNSDGTETVRRHIAAPPEFRAAIENWRKRHPKPPPMSAAVRILCEFSLNNDENR